MEVNSTLKLLRFVFVFSRTIRRKISSLENEEQNEETLTFPVNFISEFNIISLLTLVSLTMGSRCDVTQHRRRRKKRPSLTAENRF